LTHNQNYAEKVALFLRRLADETTGYPATFAAVNTSEPQEGGCWQQMAIAYDAILDANVLSAPDQRSIEHAFRLYLHRIETILDVGNVGNWNVAADTAGLFCSLALGDLSAAHRYLYGPCGFEDFVTKGIMDDGWWWEGATSYNFWVASELTQCALVCQPWGIDLLHHEFPVNFSQKCELTSAVHRWLVSRSPRERRHQSRRASRRSHRHARCEWRERFANLWLQRAGRRRGDVPHGRAV
jgi:hypothetical protein